MKFPFKKASTYIVLIVALFIIITASFWAFHSINNSVKIPFSSVESLIAAQNGELVSINEHKDGELSIITSEGKFVSHIPPNSQIIDKLVENYNVQYTFSSSSPYTSIILVGLITILAIIGFYIFKSNKGGIGATNTMKQTLSKPSPLPKISLADVGGIQGEMKEEIMQTLSILKSPERALKIGVKPPKGILLYGPPGTGKTLLAQAIAKELGATFFSTSGAAFNEMFIGVGALRVRTLFQNARKHKPAVVFIDEVDALAGKRKQHGGEESEKTLTELLVQLDGVHSNDGVLFIAATNRKDMLDEAFLRPGRIDFSFNIPLPDTNGRKEIIAIHTKKRLLANNILSSLDHLAESTSGFSGADLHSLFETASRRAVRNGQEMITKEDLDFALDRTILGSSTRALQELNTKKRVAIHEAGHALVAAITKPGSVRKATIIPRGQALGYVAPIPKEMHLSTTTDMLDQVAMILAGGIAERIILGEHSIGVSGDVHQAKQIIEQMVDTGLLEDGFTLTFNKVEKEVKMQELFQKALQKSENLITNYRTQHELIVQALLKKETVEGTEIQQIVDTIPSLNNNEYCMA
ncbi:AAA family ATPase [Bacillus sp. Bva_UNVM-123]|uniref:AAA family ATPase n=1 Tax=Bacillus sp. Bva_UNVM-123 TaxID=2829798 RepID=UPI00391FC327